jgi:hypothetical protein
METLDIVAYVVLTIAFFSVLAVIFDVIMRKKRRIEKSDAANNQAGNQLTHRPEPQQRWQNHFSQRGVYGYRVSSNGTSRNYAYVSQEKPHHSLNLSSAPLNQVQPLEKETPLVQLSKPSAFSKLKAFAKKPETDNRYGNSMDKVSSLVDNKKVFSKLKRIRL